MPKNRELMRVGVPIRARKLMALLDAVEPGDEAILRHHNGSLIVEEPEATLLDADAAPVETDPI